MPLIPDKYVFDNPFITGDAKLGDDRAAACFAIAYPKIEDGKAVSASDFQSGICAPMKQIGAWRKGLLRMFGEIAVTPASHRVISFLESPPGLKEVAACLQTGAPLHGTSDEDPGISQCHALVKELKNATSSIANAGKEGQADEAGPVILAVSNLEGASKSVTYVEAFVVLTWIFISEILHPVRLPTTAIPWPRAALC